MAGCNRETCGSNADWLGLTQPRQTSVGKLFSARTFSRGKLASLRVYPYTLLSARGLMLAFLLFKKENPMMHVLAICAAIVAVMTIMAFGEPTMQRSIGEGAQAQHSTKVRDQACYRRCRNDMRKSSSACNRMCR